MSGSQTPTSRVTILAARFWPDLYGGVEQRLWAMAQGLLATGVRVHVITENRDGLAPQETVRPGLEVTRLPRMNFGRLWRWPDLTRIKWWRDAVTHHAGRGVLWACEPSIALGAIAAGRRGDVTFNPACCAAGMNQVSRARPFVDTMKMSRLAVWTDRLAFRLSHRIVVASANLVLQAQWHYGRAANIHVVPHGVHTATRQITRSQARRGFGLEPEAFTVGFVGRLDPCKDLGFLFDAAKRGGLGESGRLLIVGDGPDRRRLEEIAAGLGLSDRIVWAGRCGDTAEAYAAMDVMVLPSVYESFGNVIREAMAAGVPVIARRRNDADDAPVLTASDELIHHGQTGLLVDSNDSSELARSLIQLQNDPGETARLGENAAHDAALWPWERTISLYMDLLDIPMSGAAPAIAA